MASHRRPAKFIRNVTFALYAALIVAACGDRAIAPTDPHLQAVGNSALHRSGGDDDPDHGGHRPGPIDARVILNEANGVITVDVTTGKFNSPTGEVPPVAGSRIEKIIVDFPKGRRCQDDFQFKRLPANDGRVSVTIPAGSCARAGMQATIIAHVKGLKKGKGTDVITVRAPVLAGDFSGVPGGQPVAFDISVTPMRQVTLDDPDFDTDVQDAQIGEPTRYDVEVANAASAIPAAVRCDVTVTGPDAATVEQYWIDGASGEQNTPPGATVTIGSNAARICRFSITYPALGQYSVRVTASTTTQAENAGNNSTTTSVSVFELPPLTRGLARLEQTDVVVIPDNLDVSNLTSIGLLSQSASVSLHWEEALETATGTDSWKLTVLSTTGGAAFHGIQDMTVSAPRITQADFDSGTDSRMCRQLFAGPHPTKPYLTSDVSVCATTDPASPGKVLMRLQYRLFSAAFSLDAPFTGAYSLFGSTFTFSAQVEHGGSSGPPKVFGASEQTVSLIGPRFAGPNGEANTPVTFGGLNTRLFVF